MDISDLSKILKNKADSKYKDFAQRLILKDVNMLGVRLPELRKIAKILAKENLSEVLQNAIPTFFFEEKMLLAMSIGYTKTDIKTKLCAVAKFISQIDNWSVCDSFCATFKFSDNELNSVWQFLEKYFKSPQEYDCRFAYVMALNHFLDEKYLQKFLRKADNFKNNFHYAKMSYAWAIATYHAKYSDEINAYIAKMDNCELKKMSIRKILESRKTSQENRAFLKSL